MNQASMPLQPEPRGPVSRARILCYLAIQLVVVVWLSCLAIFFFSRWTVWRDEIFWVALNFVGVLFVEEWAFFHVLRWRAPATRRGRGFESGGHGCGGD